MSEDDDIFSKLLIGSGLMLLAGCIPLLPQAILMGWAALYARRVAAHRDTIPELQFDMDYFTQLGVLGFKAIGVSIVWSIPLIIVSFIASMAFGALGGIVAGLLELPILGLLVSLANLLLMLVAFMAMGVFVQAAVLRVQITDDFSAGLEFGAVAAFVKTMFVPMLVSTFLTSLITMGVFLVGSLACGIGMFPATVVAFLLQASIAGQLYHLYLERGGEPWAVGPTDLRHMEAPNVF